MARERLEQSLLEQRKMLIYDYATNFLVANFSKRELGELEDEAERVCAEFPLWKERMRLAIEPLSADNPAGYTYMTGVIYDLSFDDLAESALVTSEGWGNKRLEEENPEDENLHSVKQSRLWDYIHAVTLEVLDWKQDGEKTAELANQYVRLLKSPEKPICKTEQITPQEVGTDVREREGVTKEGYLSGFLEAYFNSRQLPNATEGAVRMMDVFPEWVRRMIDYAEATASVEAYGILRMLDYGDMIALADRRINYISRHQKYLSDEEKKDLGSVKYWSQIRTYAMVAQLKTVEGVQEL